MSLPNPRFPLSLCLLLFVSAVAGSAQAQVQFAPATELMMTDHSQNDASGSLSSDNLTLYFMSDARVPSLGGFELWTATRATPNGLFGPAVHMEAPLNSPSDDGNPKISQDGLSLYITSNRPGGHGNLDGWVATRTSTSDCFEAPVNLESLSSQFEEGAPDVSANGLTAVFSSTRPGGFGDRDIYIATRAMTTEPFGSPVNLGATINTSDRERSPSLSADGLSLFFGSNRPGGLGNLDLWMSSRASLTGPWGAPVNLGPNVNSPLDDELPDLAWDGSRIVFDSDRSGTFRLYEAAIVPEPSTLASAIVTVCVAASGFLVRVRSKTRQTK